MKNKQFNIYSSFTKSVNEDKGYIDIEGWASKAYENGKPIIDRDLEHVLTSSLNLSDCKILLAQHDWDRPIGNVELSHRPEGIWLKGKVYKEMDEKTYFGVKNGILDSFSIGFTVSEASYIKVDGEDILQLSKGAVHEVSIVTIPSNTKATISSIKSIVKDGECIGLQCSIEALKKANPDQDCSCITTQEKSQKDEGNMEKKATIAEIIKGLTFEETLNDNWNEKQRLNHYLEVLAETISDNWCETIWGEEITPDEAKANILVAISAFTARLDEFTTLQNDTATVTKSVTKTADVVEEVVTPEGSEEEVQPEAEVQTPEQEEVQEVAEEPKEVATESVEDIVEGETNEETPVEEIVEPKVIGAKDVLDLVDGLDLDSLSDDEIKNIYETFTDKIENYVREALQGEEA